MNQEFFYSPSSKGFYCTTFNDVIPDDAVKVTREHYDSLLEGQSAGKVIEYDLHAGTVGLVTPELPDAEMIRRCERVAQALLTNTDWVTMSDVGNLRNKEEFATYRRKVRALRINPVVDPKWPDLPKPVWDKG